MSNSLVPRKLEGKIAVITGATSGMALATAKLFVQHGAYVFITGRRKDYVESAVKEIGKDYVTGIQSNSADLNDLDKLFQAVKDSKKAKGRIDILFASAGTGKVTEPLGAITEESFNEVFNLNVKGTLFTIQKALPLLNDGASIIINGSIASGKGISGTGVYSASKAAIRSFARTWSAELLKERKIRINVISPGPIDTAILGNFPNAEEFKKQMIAGVPLGRMGKPEEIASTALFLASDDASFISGIELCVDGAMGQV